MNKPLNSMPRDHRAGGRDAPPVAMTLTPAYRWLIVLNAVLGAAGLALHLAAAGSGH